MQLKKVLTVHVYKNLKLWQMLNRIFWKLPVYVGLFQLISDLQRIFLAKIALFYR